MPRRNVLSSTPVRASSNVSFRDTSLLPSSDPTYLVNISTLRRQWQWAAFSQFFFTFAQLLQMPDVPLTEIEDDLARGTAIYLPRIMHRLLYTMSQDRKLTIDNWQSAFRKQCLKRGSAYNPLGPEPSAPSRDVTPEPDEIRPGTVEPNESLPGTAAVSTVASPKPDVGEKEGLLKSSEAVPEAVKPETVKDELLQDDATAKADTPPESKSWMDLTMLEKLVALHRLTEWQFDNPHRLRQLMKDDGDSGLWRIDPIGYDAKTNAYWLIGPDRLWIQRALPKPPRPTKRKRAAPAKKAKAKPPPTKKEDVSESDVELEPSKRTRTGNTRASRSRVKETETALSGRGARAAKLKANKKLDAQAKELAEFQRQSALLTTPQKSPARPTRASRARPDASPSPTKRPVLGTRASARLRGAAKEDEDDEWQQIPDEWLQNAADRPASGLGRRTRSKGKARADFAKKVEDEAAQAGLGSDDAISELTELSDDQEETAEQVDTASPAAEPPEPDPPSRSKTNGRAKESQEEFLEEREDIFENTRNCIPKDFVEWEVICVTLPEWEAIGERFANATHYLEKALHKTLSQSIVPAVVAELKEVERKRKLEEAVVHRKRSSRIALREVEKEEARLTALRKTEEEEKLARARRQEARAKKEEDEREKREQAREQRRLEREARERKIQSRNEPKEPQSSVDPSSAASSRGHSLNRAMFATVNPKPSTRDWVLDCEICHQGGINVDDVSPMVSCGSCARWQHITCHDFADSKAGYPKRNWDVQQFICQRCRSARMARITNGHDRNQPVDQHAWPQPPPQRVPPTHPNNYIQPTAESRYPQQLPFDTRATYGQQTQQQYGRGGTQSSAPVYTRPQEITFSHYQPDQHGFSQTMDSTRWPGGYTHMEGVHSRPQMAQQPTQFHEQIPYGTRVTPPYQVSSSSSHPYGRAHDARAYPRGQDLHAYPRVSETQPYTRTPEDQPLSRPPPPAPHMSNGHWDHTSDNHYQPTSAQRSASHMSAAESLAFMQGSVPPVQGWSNTSYTQSHANGTHHPVTSTPAQQHPAVTNGHGPAYQFSS